MSIRSKLIRTIAWDPITWVPFTLATAGACILGLPWWANILAFTTATTVVLGVWGKMLPRLLKIWELEESAASQQQEEARKEELVTTLSRSSALRQTAEEVKTAYGLCTLILKGIQEESWLSAYDYGRNAVALIHEIEDAATALIDEEKSFSTSIRTRRSELHKEKKESITKCLEALEDTRTTMSKTIEDIHAAAESGRSGKDLAEEIKTRNRMTRRVLDQTDEGPEKQTT
jgi:hypothetical protein